MLELAEIEKAKRRGEQTTGPINSTLKVIAKRNGEERFEAHKYPVLGLNLNSKINLAISDPFLISELYGKRHKYTDKKG